MTAVGSERPAAEAGSGAPPVMPPAARPPFARPAAYTAAAAAVTGTGALLVSALPNAYPDPTLLGSLLALLLGAVVGAIVWFRGRLAHPSYLGVLSLATVLTLAFWALFKATPMGLNGFQGDAWFCNAAVTRFATTWTYSDFAHPALPSFYPPLYFWVLGKLAMLSDGPAFVMWRNALVVGCFVWPVVLFWLYRMLVGGAAAAVTVFALFLLWNDVYLFKPHTFLANALFAWWALWFLSRRPLGTGAVLAGAAIGALVFQLYYYPFFVLGLALLMVAVRRVARRDTAELRADAPALLMLGGVVLLSSVFWMPLLASLVGAPTDSHSNRWFQPSHLDFWLPLRGVVDVPAVVGLIGVGWLFSRSDRAASVAKLLGLACYGWYAVGYVTQIVFDTPLLHVRTDDLLPVVIAPWAGLGIVAAATRAESRFGRHARTAAVLLAAVCAASYMHRYVISTYRSDLYRTTAGERYIDPSGQDARIARAMGQSVVLSGIDTRALTAQFPVRPFIAPNAFFSHPAARFADRMAFLREIVTLPDPAEFARRLRENPFEPIDFVVLTVADGSEHGPYAGFYMMSLWTDVYPQGGEKMNFYLPRPLFQPADFEEVPAQFGKVFRVKPASR